MGKFNGLVIIGGLTNGYQGIRNGWINHAVRCDGTSIRVEGEMCSVRDGDR